MISLSTSNTGKYHVGQRVAGRTITGTIVRITPNTIGATSGPGILDIRKDLKPIKQQAIQAVQQVQQQQVQQQQASPTIQPSMSAAPGMVELSTRDIAKYSIGQTIERAGPNALSGVIVQIVPRGGNPGAGAGAGPGTLIIRPQGVASGVSVTSSHSALPEVRHARAMTNTDLGSPSPMIADAASPRVYSENAASPRVSDSAGAGAQQSRSYTGLHVRKNLSRLVAPSVNSGRHGHSSSASGQRETLMSGYMEKKGAKIRNWKRRWFVWQHDHDSGGQLLYFTEEDAKLQKGMFRVRQVYDLPNRARSR
jgi:hypothetical protein